MEAGTGPGLRLRIEIDWHHCSDLEVDLNHDCDFKPPIFCFRDILSLPLPILLQPLHHRTTQKQPESYIYLCVH